MAKITNNPSKIAFVIQIYDGLCLKLMKQTKDAVSIIVMDKIALKIYSLLFSRAL
jgi:hypothetical protein